MSHYFCHILFVRNKSVCSAHVQGEGITQGQEHWGSGRTGAILQAIDHSESFRFSVSVVLTLPSNQQGDVQGTRLVLRTEKLTSPSSTTNICLA